MARIQLIEARDLRVSIAELPGGAVARADGSAAATRHLLRLVVTWEALGGQVGELIQLACQVPSIGHDALTLAPDTVGVEVELVHALLGDRRDVSGVPCRLITMLLALALRVRDDVVGGDVCLFEDRRDLLTDALKRASHGRVRSLVARLEITDLMLQLSDVGVDLIAVVPPSRGLEQALPAPHQLFAHRVKANRCVDRMRVRFKTWAVSAETTGSSTVESG